MQRHKIAARFILLILSFINFAFAAPVLVRGIPEVRVDVAEDVTIASQKSWNPSDKWWTNAPDRTNTRSSLALSDSDYRLEQELGPRDPRSSIALNPSHSSLRSRVSDNSHLSPVGSPPPPHDDLPDSNATPQPSLSADSYSLSVGRPSPPAHNTLPLEIDSNSAPQRSQEPTSGSDSGHHSTGSPTDDYDSASAATYSSHSTSSELVSHSTESSSEWETSVFWFPETPSTASSALSGGNSDMGLNRFPVPTDDQLPPALSPDPGSSKRPYPLSDDSDPGPSKRPYVPSDPGPSTWAHSPSNSWPDAISPSAWYEMWATSKSPSSSPSHDSNPPRQHGNLDQFLNRPLSGSRPTDGQPSLATQSDPGPSRRPYSPSDSGRSSLTYPQAQSDPRPSRQPSSPLDAGSTTGSPPPSNPGPLELESENFFSEVFRGRFKRHISGSRYVNAAY